MRIKSVLYDSPRGVNYIVYERRSLFFGLIYHWWPVHGFKPLSGDYGCYKYIIQPDIDRLRGLYGNDFSIEDKRIDKTFSVK